ncbi:RsmB/NOP family class I SAM-dependent RNA methyltransferase [Oceaniglobus trochenteri]|uniref:RsmB/NOP family class I SAM-dependent RNA methyltransferase n=1 Tax=Oceaniglobus trochenteri TaxID=2763260 RepID=UPI001CFFD8FF|nr:RsmB/NOP family class I SAM-dependent RNA methyltransferase [Oceaniglobus trochenteri]
MTPGARVAAAIEIMDMVLAGDAAERVLTTWARQNRFAGSGDRAAIRDHVFDALRCLASATALGGAETGRGVMLGLLRLQGQDPDAFFTGLGHAPAPLTEAERILPPAPEGEVALDCPAWLSPQLRASLGDDFAPAMTLLQSRAPLFLRVNQAKGDLETARATLAAEGVETRPVDLAPFALEVVTNPRRVQNGTAFKTGLVEIQDAASQAIAQAVPLAPGQRVLDFCAGGGGKSLALVARCPGALCFAHDVDAGRMSDLPARAARAGAVITPLATGDLAQEARFDVVVVDAPCSGSGAWRRSPQHKWALTAGRLSELCTLQAGILEQAAALVAPGGTLAYMTCSLLDAENGDQISRFTAQSRDFRVTRQHRLTPLDGGDGFFLAILTRT